LGVTSERLKDSGLVDSVIPEPLGEAHRDIDEMAQRVKSAIEVRLYDLERLSMEDLLMQRQARLLGYGEFEG